MGVLKESEKLLRDTLNGDADSVARGLDRAHTQKPVLVIELKYDKSVNAAIQQIKDRHYTQALEGYAGEILLVAVNYDKAHPGKPHSCVIEKVMK